MKFEQSKAVRLVGGVIAILLGAAVLSNPYGSMLTVTKLLGWAVLVFGVVSLAAAFANLEAILSQAELYVGIPCTLLGLAIVTWVFLLLGVFVMVAGLNSLFAANASRALGLPGASLGLAGAVATVVFGALVMLAPRAMASFSMVVCGVALVFAGVVSAAGALGDLRGR